MRPLVLLATSFGLGALVAMATGSTSGFTVVAGLAAAAAVVCARRARFLFIPLLLLASFSSGGARMSAALHAPRPHCHVARHTSRRASRVLVRVVEPATPLGPQRQRQRVRALALLRGGAGAAPLCGHIDLRSARGAPALHVGDELVISGRLRPALGDRNPGRELSWVLARTRDIGARVYAAASDITLRRAAPARALWRLRAALARGIERELAAGPGRAVVRALVLGQRGEIAREQRQRFARAGVSHLLAVSGLHLSLVALGVLSLLTLLLRRVPWLARRGDVRRWAALFAAALALVYTLITGAAPSTVRACVMTCALLFGLTVGRAPDAVAPLALAGWLLVALQPLSLLRPGFQLSFAAALGILLVVRRLRARREASLLGELDAAAAQQARGAGQRLLWRALARCGRFALALLAATAAATLATAPLVAHHFGEVSLVGLLLNLFAVPLTTLVLLPSALLGACVTCVAPALGGPLLALAAEVARWLDAAAGWAASLPLSAIRVRPGWPLVLAALIAGVALLGVDTSRRSRRALLLAAALLVCGAFAWQLLGARELRAIFIDVGQGDAALLELPDGRRVLIDGGGQRRMRRGQGHASSAAGVGLRRVVPLLRRRGVDRLDLVVATHAHADHVQGLLAVLRDVAVRELWVCSRGSQASAGAARWQRRLRAAARARDVRVAAPHALRWGAVAISPLWPDGDGARCGSDALSTNDNSVVLRVDYGAARLLFTGDIERDSERALLAREPAELRATLLKVPHHGSRTSSTERFVEAVAPRLAVISCGQQNPFGFPHRSVLARYRRAGAAIARTDRDGAVIVRVSRDGSVRWRGAAGGLP